ncbi:glycosyltransferase family 4 protein [Pleurocapsa sp. PCC 7319]|uniref:glycosyltransferase family 4 protein n=1 Tax=Pleurocapsa sp. PCC 7319 TaxID=118161 RepID=UPI00034569BF|nr:glycosyltransferase family 4 protein [Pleurocapsa sp. PCC 7319]
MNNWICCQLGAREHYAIPRALHNQGRLKHLITDAWVYDDYALNLLPRFLLTNLRARYHPELNNASIKTFNYSSITWEFYHAINRKNSWDQIIARNTWWQEQVIQVLSKLSNKNITLFAYSYAALELFKYAKSQGWKTVLGQIDPGIIEEKLVSREIRKFPFYKSSLHLAPLQYWTDWRQECALADKIVVNSPWSSQALQKTGIASHKIKVIPLAYQAPVTAPDFSRTYPQNFSDQRPLKVLFLGQIIVRKGIHAILESINLLSNQPIEFWFVGQVKIDVPRTFKKHPQIKWLGAVSRSKTDYYYQQTDVFLFPTLSDGFGITQLEAQAWKLPLITSQFCGAVVKDGINGLILPNVSGVEIAKVLKYCLYHPQQLAKFSQASHQILSTFNLSQLAHELQVLNNTKFHGKPLIHY